MTAIVPPTVPSLPHDLPTPADATRADGWTPARQRRFLETLAATGVIMLACESVRITQRSAYNLRIRHDGAAFRLGWDAAILIARDRLATDLLARALTGQEEVIRKDPDNYEIRRHRHDNRLAMSMLSRLDRMADAPAEGSDAALARVVAQDFTAYCDMICPYAVMLDEVARDDLPLAGREPSARASADAQTWLGEQPDDPEPVEGDAAALVTSAASVAMFIAVRRNLLSTTARGGALGPVGHGETGLNPPVSAAHERCELRSAEAFPHLMDLPPEEAAAGLRGVWWDTLYNAWRTDFPPPPDFTGEESDEMYDPDDYQRELTIAEEQAVARQLEAEYLPYKEAAIRARDAYFGFDAAAADADDAPDPADASRAAHAEAPPT
ncbi:hypothetical protein [Sphingobium abikonense]|uniref:hypothetical protein n=1 Tax=Sphingobium abikonense TaxID=86193 RepID=UPI003516A04D